MAADKRISVADAADFLGTPEAERLISRAWRQGTAQLRGVRPGETQPVEIPPSEDGEIDCAASRIGEGTLFTTYRSVTIAWDDVERLTQAARTPPSAGEGSSNTDVLETKAGPLVKAVALELRRHFPEGRSRGLTRDKLALYVHKESGGKIAVISPATLDRAIALAWPRPEPSRAPKATKPQR